MATIERWRYHVHDGRVYCPRRGGETDVTACEGCDVLGSIAMENGVTTVECLPPQGATTAARVAALLR
jgi:hypothetical protein